MQGPAAIALEVSGARDEHTGDVVAGAVGVGVDDGARSATDHSINDTGDEGSVVGVGDDHHARGVADHSNDDSGAQDRESSSRGHPRA